MRIAVTGRHGQVAQSLAERGAALGHEIILVGRPELDLTSAPEVIRSVLAASQPDAIVSAAAYTAVDDAEDNQELAFAINDAGAGAVAEAARSLDVPVVHLSTDYVFDGAKAEPYVEDDPTGPTGVYGASKLAGERAVLNAYDNSAVLRTAWVYGAFGRNFVRTMLRLAASNERVRVVGDQRGNPTSSLDIADGVLKVVGNLLSSKDPGRRGIFHMAGSGDASWAQFAEAIFEASRVAGGPSAAVDPIPSSAYPTAAKRPANSQLNCSKLAYAHGVRLPEWRRSVEEIVQRLIRVEAQCGKDPIN